MRKSTIFGGAVALVLGAILLQGVPTNTHAEEPPNPCAKTAKHALRACADDARADFWREIAHCDNLATSEERMECRDDARESLAEALAECDEDLERRLAVCDMLPGAYNPEIDPSNFVPDVTNPYFPLYPGTTLEYETTSEEGPTKHLEITTLKQKGRVLGVSCTLVRSKVTVEGAIVEDTVEWFAQDLEGNVWLMGEISRELQSGEVMEVERWKAGDGAAQPGIIMKGTPEVGDVYRTEFALGTSEDITHTLATGVTVVIGYGTFEDCILQLDESPLEPDDTEEKTYSPFLGMVLEINTDTGERTELVNVRTSDDD